MVQEAILGSVGPVTKPSPHWKYAWLQEFHGLGSLGMLLPSDGSNTDTDSLYVVYPSSEWVDVGCFQSPVNEKKLCLRNMSELPEVIILLQAKLRFD